VTAADRSGGHRRIRRADFEIFQRERGMPIEPGEASARLRAAIYRAVLDAFGQGVPLAEIARILGDEWAAQVCDAEKSAAAMRKLTRKRR
jgi:hypothetical protein